MPELHSQLGGLEGHVVWLLVTRLLIRCRDKASQVFSCRTPHQLIALSGHALEYWLRCGAITGNREALQPASTAEVLGEEVGGALGQGEQEAAAGGWGAPMASCFE